MKKLFLSVWCIALSGNVLASASLKIGEASYINGDAIIQAAYTERWGLSVVIRDNSSLRYKGMTHEEGAKLAKKIALGEPSEVVDLTSFKKQ
ncbi:hypothetical protein [Enterovibrio norvegicus]|uniref:hypothetical protein n=1 Tax=Enterovibrio norvegicus TaxID=188144 RepID=UPI000C82C5DF|nr:hypothetical protein [Enterovibrio norvegicus]MCC4799648.1 hypothetical protein [Enterovibrio norvegicus]PML77529.1 hypothetical protein BCT69_18845 [Enterovibrio norvegicus]